MLEDRILFINDDAIIIDKPAGLPVDTPRRGGESVVSLADKLRLGREVPVPMHRLDQDTSGCLLLARNIRARRRFQQAFESGNALKYYLAVVDGEVEGEEGKIDVPLAKRSTSERGWWVAPDPKGQPAETRWTVFERRGGQTLVRFEPRTGRTHQIRAHALAAFGAGIVGDPVYGSGKVPMMLHAIRLSVAEGDSIFYSAHAVAPLPDSWGGWRVDPATVAADEETLKAQLRYLDWERDLEGAVYSDLDRPMFAEAARAGLPLSPTAESFLERAYVERGAWEALAARLSGFHAAQGDAFRRIPPLLVAAGRPELAEKMWRSVTRRARATWFAKRSEAYKASALNTFDAAIVSLEESGLGDAAADLRMARAQVEGEVFPTAPPATDLRPMDVEVFWALICDTRNATATADEQVALLADRLAAFPATEIRKFATMFAGLMKKLHHWNVWALAWAARDGCSDDSFVDFRTWLILQGDPALIDLAIADPATAAGRVPKNPDLPFEGMAHALDSATLLRTGKTRTLPAFDHEEPRGKEWDEDRFDETFPALAAHYAA